MEVVLISLFVFFMFASFIVGKYFGIMQERRKNNYEIDYLKMQASEIYMDAIYDGVGEDHKTFNQQDENVVSVYFSKDDFVDDLISNRIMFSVEENKYIKADKDK